MYFHSVIGALQMHHDDELMIIVTGDSINSLLNRAATWWMHMN